MKKLALAVAPLFLILALGVVGCGKTPGGGNASKPSAPANAAVMTSDNFANHTVTIKAGEQVDFKDPGDSGGTHIICLGHDEKCDPSAQGPSDLKGQGFTINAGDPDKMVTFPTAGTYQITCSVHPNMNLTVTVQ